MTGARLVAAAAVALSVAWHAPAAAAGPLTAGCGHREVQYGGGRADGVAYAYAVGHATDQLTVYCVVRADGVEVARTPAGAGTGAAVSSGAVSYQVGARITWCVAGTRNGTPWERCDDGTPVQVVPQSVIDLLIAVAEEADRVLAPVWDLLIEDPGWGWYDRQVCAVLQMLAGTYGPVFVNSQGDVFVAGEPLWDCPPYDLWPAT